MNEKEKFQELLFKLRNAEDYAGQWASVWDEVINFGEQASERSVKDHTDALRGLALLATWELCAILKKRSSVEEIVIAPYDNISVEVEGPAYVYVVTD